MKKHKRLLALFLCLSMILPYFPAFPVTAGEDISVSDAQITGASENESIQSSVSLNLSELELTVGESVSLKAEVQTSSENKTLYWTSTDESVAVVSQNGLVTALAPGSSAIRAGLQDGSGAFAECLLHVKENAPDVIEVTGIELSVESLALKEGEHCTVSVNILPEDATDQSFSALSRDPDIADAVISGNSVKVIAISEGNTIIDFCTANDHSASLPVSVSKNATEEEDIPDADDKNRSDKGIWVSSINDSSFIYSGEAYRPMIRVYDIDCLLEEGRDYTLSYKNNINVYELEDPECLNATDIAKAPQVIIKMKGNYSGQTEAFFSIHPMDISTEAFSAEDISFAYTGKAQAFTPLLCRGGIALKAKSDFNYGILQEDGSLRALSAEERTGSADAAVEYEITLQGSKNYCGSRNMKLRILPIEGAIAMDKVKVSAIPAQEYNGSAFHSQNLLKNGTPFPLTLSYKKQLLEAGVDYEVIEASNAVMPGKYTIILKGLANSQSSNPPFVGQKTVSFTIKAASIKKAVVSGIEASYQTQSGDTFVHPDESGITLQLNGRTLPADEYEISYKNDSKAGKASIIFSGKGGCSGKKSVSYKIVGRDLSSEGISMSIGESVFQKGGAKPEVIVTDGTRVLTAGTDYTLKYNNNKKLSTEARKQPTVSIKGMGLYSGKLSQSFSIAQHPFRTEAGISVLAQDKVYSPKAGKYTTKVKVTDENGKALKAGTDYEKNLVYLDEEGNILDKTSVPENGSVITVRIIGKGGYMADTIETSYRILSAGMDISKAKVGVKAQYYAGYGQFNYFPEASTDYSVKLNGTALRLVRDGEYVQPLDSDEDGDEVNGFEIVEGSYKNNDKVGTASVMLHGVGIYGGYKTVKFTIKARAAESVKATRRIPIPEKYIDVTTLNVFPDDEADDTDAINNAIRIAANDPENNYTLYFPEGVYNIGESNKEIYISEPNVTMVLHGNAVLYRASSGKDGYNVIHIKASNTTIRGGELAGERFRHNGGSVGQYGMGISIDNGKNITIRDMLIHDNRGDGIYINDGGKGTIQNVTIQDCEIYDNSRNNIGVVRADYVTISGCNIYHNHDGISPMAGIDLEPDGSASNMQINHVTIKNCTVRTYNNNHAQEVNKLWTYYGIMIIYGYGTPVVNDVTIQNCEIYGDLSIGSSSGVSWPGTNVHGDIIPGDT